MEILFDAARDELRRMRVHLKDVLEEVVMASIADAEAAFETYKSAVDAKIAELSAAAESADAQPLVDSIAAASAEINPPAPEEPAQDVPAA